MKKSNPKQKSDETVNLLNRFILTKKIKLRNCPVCGDEKSLSYIGQYSIPAFKNDNMDLNEFMPVITVECIKCHYLMFFPINPITSEMKEKTEPEKKS